MKKIKELVAVCLLLGACIGKVSAQQSDLEFKRAYVFSLDSIAGFDEEAAKAAALAGACYGNEYKMFMYLQKRKFVNAKYNIVSQRVKNIPVKPTQAVYINAGKAAKVMASSGACSNEDFEDAQANIGPQIGGAVNGWTLSGDYGANFCNPFAMNATNLYTVFNAPTTDPYMLFPNNTISSYFDAVSNSQPAGNCFIRLNDDLAGAKVVKMSKSYIVTPNNAVFRYAYRAVISDPNHGCCDQPGFRINVTITNTVTGSSTLLACPNVSVAAGNACGPAPQGFSVGNYLNGSPSAYNAQWVPASMDLSANIGNQVTLDVYAIDCSLGGHAGYVYFDALCSPMTILGNGNDFPAGTPSITLPTCGANGATITAPPGLGPYSWNSNQITIPANLTIPNYTNTTLVTNQSGTVMLTMAPPGGCAPINKVITVSITPAPIALATATQSGCTNTLSAASLTTAGSASVNPVITWSPMPGSLSNNSLTATGLPIGITTITVLDPLGCKVTVTLNILPAPPPVTFSVNNLTGSYSITCINPTINLQAVTNYTYGTLSYSWTSPSFTANTTTVGISAPIPTLIVTATDPVTGCQATLALTIDQFTTQPTNTVTPLTQAITCNSGAPVTFSGTVSSPTVNIQHDWYSPLNPLPGGVPIATSNNTISILSGELPPGVYTLQTTNLVNGCKSSKTVTITSLSAWPTFSLSSPNGFSVGCAPLNSTTLSIVNPVSTQTPPATCSFSFLPPGFAGTVSPGVPLGPNSSTITTVPGTWTVIVQDNSNFCRSILSVPVLQNTVAPHVAANVPTYTLTCKDPTVLATGTSTTPYTDITWNVPSNPPNLSTPTVVIGDIANGPPPSTTALTYANFTVVATNSLNACESRSVIPIYQNFKAPVSSPIISVGTPTAIYCTAGVAPAVLSASAVINSGGGPTAFAVVVLWQGPSPQPTVAGASSYSCYIPGIYSLTIMDNYNGCSHTGTINVADRTQPPVLVETTSTATLDCGNNSSALLKFDLAGTTAGGIRYLVTEYPAGAAFLPTNAIVKNVNPVLSGTTSQSVTVDKLGSYEFVVSNTLTGCQTRGVVNVIAGGLNADFDASSESGYAPLTVNFDNNSASSSGTSSIVSVWSFGNGTAETTASVDIHTSATYTAAGNYTVMLLTQKGSCIDTAYKIIRVDIPSKIEIPNIFTPNGDGSNDVFFLKAANLTEITAVFFDRWGNKVYDVTSTNGNIAWDGKNLNGKECASGVYFYHIVAKGRDGAEYKEKGNVTILK